jgi:hypothetical protein
VLIQQMKRQLRLQTLKQYKQVLPTPLKQYETTLIWSGNSCFNPVEKTGRRIFTNLQMEEIEYPFHLSSVDNLEKIEYKLYSVEPLMWSENDDLFIEMQEIAKVESTKQPRKQPVALNASKKLLSPVEKDPAENYRSLLAKFVKPNNKSQ